MASAPKETARSEDAPGGPVRERSWSPAVDRAPAYATIDYSGIVVEENLLATTLFGASGVGWIGRNFKFTIVAEDQDIYHLSRKRLLRTGAPQACKLRMYRENKLFWAGLNMVFGPSNGSPETGVIIVEITEITGIVEESPYLPQNPSD